MRFYLDFESSMACIAWSRTGLGHDLYPASSSVVKDAAHTKLQTESFDRRKLGVPHEVIYECFFLMRNTCKGNRVASVRLIKPHLPMGAFLCVNEQTYICAPALCIIRAARQTDASLPQLAAMAMEFAGSYATASVPETLAHCCYKLQPIATVKEMTAFATRARKLGVQGSKAAIAALKFAIDGSASYMETVSALTLSLPPRHGGLGLPKPELNKPVKPENTMQYIAECSEYKPDIYWPAYSIDIEYDGRHHENEHERAIDRKRQNDLVAMGITVLRVTNDDLKTTRAFIRFEAKLIEVLATRGCPNVRRLRRRVNDIEFFASQANLLNSLLGVHSLRMG